MHMYFELHFNMWVKKRRRRKVKLVILMMASRPWGNWTMGWKEWKKKNKRKLLSFYNNMLPLQCVHKWLTLMFLFSVKLNSQKLISNTFFTFAVPSFLCIAHTHTLYNTTPHYKPYTKCKTNNINWWYCMLKLCTIISYLMGNQWNWTCFNFF